MKMFKVADGAMFVSSYSEQTIAPSYDDGTSLQTFGHGSADVEAPFRTEALREWDKVAIEAVMKKNDGHGAQ